MYCLKKDVSNFKGNWKSIMEAVQQTHPFWASKREQINSQDTSPLDALANASLYHLLFNLDNFSVNILLPGDAPDVPKSFGELDKFIASRSPKTVNSNNNNNNNNNSNGDIALHHEKKLNGSKNFVYFLFIFCLFLFIFVYFV